MVTPSIPFSAASYHLSVNNAGYSAQFSSNKNPPVGQLLDYLNSPAFVTTPDNWIDNNCSAIHKLLTKKNVDLNELVKNVGIEDSFALLVLCYRSASRSAEKQIFPWRLIADDFGALLKELATERFGDYSLLSLSNLKFTKEQIDRSFLKKLEGVSEQERSSCAGTVCKVALGALALVGVAFAGISLLTKEPTKPVQCPSKEEIEAVRDGLRTSCFNIGKQIFGDSFIGSNTAPPLNHYMKCYIYVDSVDKVSEYARNVACFKNEFNPYIEGSVLGEGEVLKKAAEWNNPELDKSKCGLAGDDRAFAKTTGTYIEKYWSWIDNDIFNRCAVNSLTPLSPLKIRSYKGIIPSDCLYNTCMPFSVEYRTYAPDKSNYMMMKNTKNGLNS